ncbi:hypothetical protein CFP56_032225 [Quercus suber]|uniref:Uncharacterized protein n=1 Tax=Quercus suber TaxID=58331 RepID=A0AAW0LS57_QUESU
MASSSVDAILVLVNVILRKSIYVYKEFAVLMVDFLPVMVSTIRFSRFFFRPTTVVSASLPLVIEVAIRAPNMFKQDII